MQYAPSSQARQSISGDTLCPPSHLPKASESDDCYRRWLTGNQTETFFLDFNVSRHRETTRGQRGEATDLGDTLAGRAGRHVPTPTNFSQVNCVSSLFRVSLRVCPTGISCRAIWGRAVPQRRLVTPDQLPLGRLQPSLLKPTEALLGGRGFHPQPPHWLLLSRFRVARQCCT